METLRQAFAARVRKQHHADGELMKKLNELENLSNPIEAVEAMSALVE
jgi:hypothetical protein